MPNHAALINSFILTNLAIPKLTCEISFCSNSATIEVDTKDGYVSVYMCTECFFRYKVYNNKYKVAKKERNILRAILWQMKASGHS